MKSVIICILVGTMVLLPSSFQQVDNIGGFVLYKRLPNAVLEYVLLEKKKEPGDWSPPKGNMDTGEDWKLAAIRETWEETGYTESDYRPFWFNPIYFEYTTNADVLKRVTLAPCNLTNVDKPVVIDPNENSEYVWAQYSEACSLIKRQYREAFAEANVYIREQEGIGK